MAGSAGLRSGLHQRQMTMIAIGGVIGAGLFVGSGKAIGSAGPGVLLAYLGVGMAFDSDSRRSLALTLLVTAVAGLAGIAWQRAHRSRSAVLADVVTPTGESQ